VLENGYLMESDQESQRLDSKIDPQIIRRQAEWAGIRPGMRVADLGCGSGRISAILHEMVQPGGSVIGVDGSSERLAYAGNKYGRDGIEFRKGDLTEPLDLPDIDFIWVRFVLEYHLQNSPSMVRNFADRLCSGGILCLIDLDHNPFNYFGAPARLDRTFKKIMAMLEKSSDFDPYVGRKLYSFVYDLGFQDIDVRVENYKITFGMIDQLEVANMLKKIEIVPRRINFDFKEYAGGYEEFRQEAHDFLADSRRFSYAPLILCRGIKP
jgi:ubiquinone/menaquinone biosynthesis C-methylase UbiE